MAIAAQQLSLWHFNVEAAGQLGEFGTKLQPVSPGWAHTAVPLVVLVVPAAAPMALAVVAVPATPPVVLAVVVVPATPPVAFAVVVAVPATPPVTLSAVAMPVTPPVAFVAVAFVVPPTSPVAFVAVVVPPTPPVAFVRSTTLAPPAPPAAKVLVVRDTVAVPPLDVPPVRVDEPKFVLPPVPEASSNCIAGSAQPDAMRTAGAQRHPHPMPQ